MSTALKQHSPVFGVGEWCKELGISQALYFLECKKGRGPLRGNVGRRVVIIETPADFVRRVGGAK